MVSAGIRGSLIARSSLIELPSKARLHRESLRQARAVWCRIYIHIATANAVVVVINPMSAQIRADGADLKKLFGRSLRGIDHFPIHPIAETLHVDARSVHTGHLHIVSAVFRYLAIFLQSARHLHNCTGQVFHARTNELERASRQYPDSIRIKCTAKLLSAAPDVVHAPSLDYIASQASWCRTTRAACVFGFDLRCTRTSTHRLFTCWTQLSLVYSYTPQLSWAKQLPYYLSKLLFFTNVPSRQFELKFETEKALYPIKYRYISNQLSSVSQLYFHLGKKRFNFSNQSIVNAYFSTKCTACTSRVLVQSTLVETATLHARLVSSYLKKIFFFLLIYLTGMSPSTNNDYNILYNYQDCVNN